MAVLPIYNCFHPILKNKATDVANIDQILIDFVNDMLETMDFAEGVGLAANQVGDPSAIFTVDDYALEGKKDIYNPKILINPVITAYSEKVGPYKEGCLSIPGIYEEVIRPLEVEVQYLDINGNQQLMGAGGLLARVIQHELDHLNGILFIERLSPLKKTVIKSKIKKVQNAEYESFYNMILANDKLFEATYDKEKRNKD